MAVKKLEISALLEKAKKSRSELANLILDKNMDKLKDVRMINKTRKNLAQILTIVRQKQLMEELESKVKNKAVNNQATADSLSAGKASLQLAVKKKKAVVSSRKTVGKPQKGAQR